MKPKKRKVGLPKLTDFSRCTHWHSPWFQRPRLPNGEVLVAIRVTKAEKRDYEKRAAREGLDLSGWIRLALQRVEMEPPQEKPIKCRHCRQWFIPGPNKVGYINECPHCSDWRYA